MKAKADKSVGSIVCNLQESLSDRLRDWVIDVNKVGFPVDGDDEIDDDFTNLFTSELIWLTYERIWSSIRSVAEFGYKPMILIAADDTDPDVPIAMIEFYTEKKFRSGYVFEVDNEVPFTEDELEALAKPLNNLSDKLVDAINNFQEHEDVDNAIELYCYFDPVRKLIRSLIALRLIVGIVPTKEGKLKFSVHTVASIKEK